LLRRAHRTSGDFRLFEPEVVKQFLFITHTQEIGLSLDKIRELLTVSGGAGA
jgi:DNA-binding transcriptional MerR regulator